MDSFDASTFVLSVSLGRLAPMIYSDNFQRILLLVKHFVDFPGISAPQSLR